MISVIIPVYNDPDGLSDTVNSLLDQTARPDLYEIIIVDNMSTDETPKVAKSLSEKNPNVNFVTEDEVQSSYAARNTGIQRAQGELLAFVDSNMTVGNTYIESIEKKMKENDRKYMGCDVRVVTKEDANRIARYNQARAFPVEHQIKAEKFAPTACLVVHREIFEEVGLFDGDLISGGDYEFGHRVVDAGYKLTFEPNIILCHPARASISALLRRQFRFGRGRIQRQRKYPARFSYRSLFDIRRWLPSYPWKFRNRYEEHSKSSFDLLIWYMLEYIVKLSNNMGQIYEKRIGKTST